MEKIDTKINFKDDRGEIIDLVQNQLINAITVITFSPGSIRANHYHKKTTQWNYLLSGKIKIFTQLDNEEIKENILYPGDLVLTIPNEKHALQAIEESKLMVFTEGPRGGNGYESDTFRLDKPLI